MEQVEYGCGNYGIELQVDTHINTSQSSVKTGFLGKRHSKPKMMRVLGITTMITIMNLIKGKNIEEVITNTRNKELIRMLKSHQQEMK